MSPDRHEYAGQIRQMEIEGRLPIDDTSWSNSKCPACGAHGSHACMGPQPKPDPGVLEVQEVYDSMNPDPHDACKETIKARERSITDLLYRVRELESQIRGLEVTRQGDMQDYSELAAERDEWKAKAERREMDEDAFASMIAAICAYAGIENDPDGTLDAFANKVIHRVRELERQRDQWRMNASSLMKVGSDLEAERDEWKAKAEQMEKAEDRYHDYIRELEKQVEDYARQLRADSHYCCYHIRWETREGAGV